MVLKAVLFDFDGVLVDGENYHIAAWQRALAPLGWAIAEPPAARAAELDDGAFLAEYFGSRGVSDYCSEPWMARKQAIAVELFRDAPRFYAGTVELVKHLAGRIKLGIVTTTWRENVAAALAARGLDAAFEVIVAREDVRAPKPDPEGYKLALARLRLRTAAMAIEDSPSGVAAARAAGLKVLAVGHRRPPGDWTQDATYLPALEPLAPVLEAIGL